MSLPTITKTWIIDPCNRVPYVSLLDTMQNYLYGAKEFLKLNGYTVKGSASAGVGAMDAVDRWTSSAAVTPRATIAAASQAWIVLIDGNGVNILLDYQGASDDIARIAFSPGGLYVAAGTPNQQPTATDDQLLIQATLIGTTTSGDRVWSGWTDSTSKLCRFVVASGGAWVGRQWGIEEYSHVVSTPAIVSPPVWGFVMTPVGTYIGSGTVMGLGRAVVSSVPFNMTIRLGCEFMPAGTGGPFAAGTVKAELQGGSGHLIVPLAIASHTVGARGKLGNLYDTWVGRTDNQDGFTYGAFQFIGISGYQGSNTGSGLWPWDGSTDPVMW